MAAKKAASTAMVPVRRTDKNGVVVTRMMRPDRVAAAEADRRSATPARRPAAFPASAPVERTGRSLKDIVAEKLIAHNRCKAAVAFERLSPADRQELDELLAEDPDYLKNGMIAAGLKDIGVVVSEQLIGRHRRGDCSCDTP